MTNSARSAPQLPQHFNIMLTAFPMNLAELERDLDRLDKLLKAYTVLLRDMVPDPVGREPNQPTFTEQHLGCQPDHKHCRPNHLQVFSQLLLLYSLINSSPIWFNGLLDRRMMRGTTEQQMMAARVQLRTMLYGLFRELLVRPLTEAASGITMTTFVERLHNPAYLRFMNPDDPEQADRVGEAFLALEAFSRSLTVYAEFRMEEEGGNNKGAA